MDGENRAYTVTEYLTRDDFFTSGCRDNGCWSIDTTAQTVFMSTPSTTNPYSSPVFTGQVSGADFYNALTPNGYFRLVTGTFPYLRLSAYLRNANTAVSSSTTCTIFFGKFCWGSSDGSCVEQRGSTINWEGYANSLGQASITLKYALRLGFNLWRSNPPFCADFRASFTQFESFVDGIRQGNPVLASDCRTYIQSNPGIWCPLPGSVMDKEYAIVYPAGGAYLVRNFFYNRIQQNTGTVGTDLVLGLQDNPYMPWFMQATIFITLDAVVGRGFRAGEVIAQPTVPRYVGKDYGAGLFTLDDQFPLYTSAPPACRACYLTLDDTQTGYDRHTYSTLSTWPINLFTPPEPPYLNVLRPQGWERLIELESTERGLFVHQTVFINTYDANAAVPWQVDACVTAGPGGFLWAVCDDQELNFVCMYDYTKYTV